MSHKISQILNTQPMGIYREELRLLFEEGDQFCTGLVVSSAADFREYPPDLMDQLMKAKFINILENKKIILPFSVCEHHPHSGSHDHLDCAELWPR